MIQKKPSLATWKCDACKHLTTIRISQGVPHGGSCGKQPKDANGKYKPHVWVKINEH